MLSEKAEPASAPIEGELQPAGTVAAEEVIPPELRRIVEDLLPKKHRIGDLATLSDVRAEMSRVYRRMWAGQITLGQGTRIFYMLDKLQKTIAARIEHGEAEGADRGAWAGVQFVGVDGEKWKLGKRAALPAPSSQAPASSQPSSSRSTPPSSQRRS